MIRKILCAVLVLGLGTGPVLALSCMPPDLARTYKEAADSEASYIVVHGKLSFDEKKLPKADFSRQEDILPDNMIPARLVGHSLSKSGFNTRFDRPITLNAKCFGPWCTGATSGISYLAFLEKTESGYVLALNPCGGFGFAKPSAGALEKITQCFKGGACTPNPLAPTIDE